MIGRRTNRISTGRKSCVSISSCSGSVTRPYAPNFKRLFASQPFSNLRIFSQFDSFIPLGLATFCFVSNLLWHRPGLLLADNCVYLAVASSHYTMGGTGCACFVSVMFDAMKMKDRDFGGGYSHRWNQTVLMGQI